VSRTHLRYGSAALVGTLALGFAINQSAVATTGLATPLDESVIDRALASLPDTASRADAPQAITTGVVVPALTHLSIPNLGAAVTAQGYALRDLLVDATPDLADRDLAFVVQRLDGENWVEAASGTTAGADDLATVANMPAGTYRVVIPAQFGMAEFVGSPMEHQPRQLTAGLSYNSADYVTTVDISPDPSGAYQFTLQRKSGSTWQDVETLSTSSPDGGYGFTSIPSGTYRIVVPDQADALGATSNEVTVVSRADAERAAAEAAAEAAAAAARAAAPAPSSSSGSRAPAPSPAPAPAPAPAPSYSDAPAGNTGGIVGTALAQVGDRYVRGGNGPDVFDCSGLTSYAYRSAGISIPRTASAQWAASARVSNPRPGDLVFFNSAGHVGIYLGNGQMVHAANPSRPVEVVSINAGWYGRTFMGFGRF
jgi:cell wall-associated NlpC family hydrolase